MHPPSGGYPCAVNGASDQTMQKLPRRMARDERVMRQSRLLTRWAVIFFILGTLTFRARNADALSLIPR